MARFAFRLQRVLDYRRMQVEWAASAVGSASAGLAAIEGEIEALNAATLRAVAHTPIDVNGRLAAQGLLETLDARARGAEIQRAEAAADLDRAQDEWRGRKAELGAIEALEAADRKAWRYLEERAEQAALDEWAVTRPREREAA